MVEDCLSVVNAALVDSGYTVSIADSFSREMPNLVIDEFTDFQFNASLKDFKAKNPEVKVFVILTEFFSRRYGVESFNFLGGLPDASMLALLRVVIKTYRNDLGCLEAKEVLHALVLSPFLFISLIQNAKNWIRGHLGQSVREKVYFLIRQLGFSAAIQYFEGWITLHPSIMENSPKYLSLKNHIGTIYPVVTLRGVAGFQKGGRRLGVMFSGSLTPYRAKFFAKFARIAICLGVFRRIGRVRIKSADGGSIADEFFSIHPPKAKNAKYSSPVRIYRAIEIDSTIPVITRCHGQHPIENICFYYRNRFSVKEMIDAYTQKERFIPDFIKKLDHYNDLAVSMNRTTLGRLRERI